MKTPCFCPETTLPIQQQVKKGEWNFYLDPVYLVAIVDFVLDEDRNDSQVLCSIQLKDQTCRVFFDKLTLLYIELPKFNKREEALETTSDKWACTCSSICLTCKTARGRCKSGFFSASLRRRR
ncbi:MAG: PD-(D/E)XK nuclease family transposase [Saprospiraceae bacterium]|nr:Rpn family recombination-promoting nuclease/putative transposase [Saprospiraceae bacterium]MDW8229646.1 PD-(D/E)XK nuclease family transposase [Saprospiraceae bacterium]